MNDIKTGIQTVCQELYDMHGFITASSLLDAARPKGSPAHAGFDWNDKTAAEEYRLIQSRKWIRAIRIIDDPGQEPQRLVNISRIIDEDASEDEKSNPKEGEYKPISVVISNPDEFHRALVLFEEKHRAAKEALEELLDAARKNPEMHETSALIAQISRGLELVGEAIHRMH